MLEAFQELDGNVQVIFERQGAAVEHVAVEEVGKPGGPAPLGFLHQRQDEGVQLVRRAMVGVQGHVDRVAPGDPVHVLGNGDGAKGHVLDRRPRSKGGTAGGNLDDPVAPAFGEPPQHGIGRGQ